MAGIVLPQLAPASEDRVSGAQVVDNSLRFDRDNKTHLLKTFSTIGSSSRFTWSYWIKRTKFGVGDQRVFSSSAGNGNPGFVNWFTSNDVLEARHYNGSAWDIVFQTTNKFRDTGWYHIVCAIDVTESAATDRIKIYVNGTRETLFNTTTYGPARYEPLVFNGSNKSAIGSGTASGNEALDAHLSNYYAIDGFALGPESFGYTDPLTGVWRPKKFSGELNPPFSDNWEGDTTGTGFNADTNKQNAFDGNPNTQAATGQNGTMSFTPTPAITGISKVRIKARRDAGANVPANFTLNGTTIGDLWTAGNVATVEITSLGGNPISQLTNLTWKGNTNNNEWFGVYMIEVYSNGAYHTLRQGGNAFYLPMDGDSPIGLDQSGKGNDFTPVNFGGSVTLDKATGARPILNTGNSGNIARPGVFGSEVSAFYETTSASNSGGQYYFSHDSSAKPTFSFVRGATYTFDYSASSSHPLRFATAADAAGSTEYTDGTSISGNVIKFTVPHNAPDTLYYYCNVHNGMGNSISVITDETKADPYAWKCVLALPLVGDDDDQSKNINCTQSAAKTVTPGGNAQKSSLRSNFYGGSFVFDGSGDKLTIADSADWDIGSGDFTIELWANQVEITNTNAMLMCQWGATGTSGTWYIQYDSLTQIGVNFRDDSNLNNAGNPVSMTAPASPNRWQHIAVTRNGNTWRLFVDGILQNSATSSITVANASEPLRIGMQGYTSYRNGQPFDGFIQDVRFYKGVAKYTSDFIPAATSPDVLPVSPSSTAVKPKLTKITDGAVSFDGTGDYLSTSVSSSDFTFGTGDFTIEMFLYNRETAGKGFIQFSDSSGGLKNTSSGVVTIHKNNGADGAFRAYAKNTSTGFSTPVPYKRWCHVALVRESGTIKLFVDGKQDATTITNDTTDYITTYVAIGGYYDTSYLSDCTISNVRVNKGTALYTSDFTPPTRTLTNVTNTKLLCCQSNTQAGSAAASPNLGGVNDGTQWSSYLTASGNSINREPADAFSGHTWSFADASNSGYSSDNTGNYISFDPPSGSLVGQVVKLYQRIRPSTVTVNGTSATITTSGNTRICTVDLGSSTSITNITTTATTDGETNAFGYLEVDGVRVKDPISPRGNSGASTSNPFNTDIDAIRGQEGNYCTWNPLRNGATLSNGNLDVSSSQNARNTFATMGVSSGKWFWEVTINSVTNTHYPIIGVNTDLSQELDQQSGGANDPDGYMLLASGLTFNNDDTAQYGTDAVAGDVMGVALDMDAGTISFYHNGKDLGVALSGITGTAVPTVVSWTGSTCSANFGQKPFSFPPPDGFQLLTSSTARPDATDTTPTITRPGDFVGATAYQGNNTNPRNLGLGHPTDLVWIKKRNATENNNISDSVRGPNNWISSDNNNAANTNGGPVLGFNDDGVTVDNNGYVNGNNDKYVAWSWRAGGKDGSNAFNIDDVGYATAAAAQQSVGSQNSSGYDTSDVWSDDLSSPNGAYSGSSVTSAFNGNLTNGFEAGNPSNNYSTIRFQPASPITVNTQIRIHVFDYNGSNVTYQWRVNDGSWNNMPGTSSPYRRWQDLSFTGSLTSFEYRSNTSVTYKPTLYAVEIDGKILVNTGTDLSGLTQYPSIAPAGSSVGTKQGFSILKWNSGGSNGNFTLAHGLGREPKFIITRSLASANTWVYHKSQVGTDYRKHLQLNSNAGGQTNSANFWGESGHTDTLYGVRVGDLIGQNQDAISYLWADVPGLQKFGSYKANGDGSGGGDEDGPFVELGFRPAMILFKGNHTSDWTWIDNARCTTNYNDVALRANYHYSEIGNARGGVGSSSQPENYAVDFLSNGFKVRASGGSINGGTNIIYYAAWAEAPQFNLYGAQSNAR